MANHYYLNTVVSLSKNIEQSYVNNLTKGERNKLVERADKCNKN